MKNVGFFLKALVITPIMLATSLIMFWLSYMLIPFMILAGIFVLLKADDAYDGEDDDNKD